MNFLTSAIAPLFNILFTLEFAFRCFNAERLEREIHKDLKGARVAKDREFFAVSLNEAKEVIEQKILINQYSKFNQKETTVYLNICKKKFIITILNKGKLLLNNTFDYQNNEDFLYYILFCFEQLDLSTEKTKIILHGLITESDEKFKIIYKYIRNVTFGERPKQFNYSKNIEQTEGQKYFGLFSQVLCA